MQVIIKRLNSQIHELVFIGNLRRFNEDRNINFIINCFKNEIFKINISLKNSAPVSSDELDKLINNKGLQDKVELVMVST